MVVRYQAELHDCPCFASWLIVGVTSVQDAGEHVDDDVVQYNYLLSDVLSQTKKTCMQFCIRGAEGSLVTRNSCIVAFFTQQIPWGLRNGQPIETTKEYVGHIKEILELDYRNHCTTMIVCDWVHVSRDI